MNDFWPLQSNRHMQNVTLTAEEFNALIAQREAAVTEREALRSELKVLKIERDLLQEKLNALAWVAICCNAISPPNRVVGAF